MRSCGRTSISSSGVWAVTTQIPDYDGAYANRARRLHRPPEPKASAALSWSALLDANARAGWGSCVSMVRVGGAQAAYSRGIASSRASRVVFEAPRRAWGWLETPIPYP